jgi:hypothetical protein
MAETVIRLPLTADARVTSSSVRMRFVVDEVAVGLVFLPVLRFSPVIIIPPLLRTRNHLDVAFTKLRKSRSLAMSQQQCSFRNPWHWAEKCSRFFT